MTPRRQASAAGNRPSGPMALVREAVLRWVDSDAPGHSAALAFYTLFSLAPVLLIVLAVAGTALGTEATQREIERNVATLFGPQSAELVGEVLAGVSRPTPRGPAGLGALVALLLGATAFFGQLQQALNAVWGVAPEEGHRVGAFLRRRLLSFVVVVALGLLLLVSLAVSTALSAFGAHLEARLGVPPALLQAGDLGLFLLLSTLLFALIFRLLPDARIAWRDVGLGAAATAVLFAAGKLLIGFYLGRTGLSSAYGAAGSLVLLLLWVYYTSMILLLGAGFTRVWSKRHGATEAQPAPGARRVAEGGSAGRRRR